MQVQHSDISNVSKYFAPNQYQALCDLLSASCGNHSTCGRWASPVPQSNIKLWIKTRITSTHLNSSAQHKLWSPNKNYAQKITSKLH